MNTYACIVVAVAAFDLFLIMLVCAYLRSHAPLDHGVLFPVAAGLIGFVIHALVFFSGALLYVQLATIASIFGLYLFWSSKDSGRKKPAA